MKYEKTNITKQVTCPETGFTCTVHQIRALKDFGSVKKGAMGGWVQYETNLFHEGSCWIYDDAVVIAGAQVREDAKVRGRASLSMNVIVEGAATVMDDAIITHRAYIAGESLVCDFARVREEARVTENSVVRGTSCVEERAKVQGQGYVDGNAIVRGCARVRAKCTVDPISITGTIYDVTITDDEMCCGCVSFPFEEWVRLASGNEKDFVRSLVFASESFETVNDRITPATARKVYKILRRSLGFLGRIAQVYGRDVSGFDYIDDGYRLSVSEKVRDSVDPSIEYPAKNSLDPSHFLE